MSFDKCMHQNNHHYTKDLEHFLYPTKSPFLPSPLLQAITKFMSVTLDLE